MPLVHIHLIKGKSKDHVRSISNSIHQAIVEAYGAPADDKFHLVHQCDKDDFIYDANYLGIRRSDDLVMINVVAGNWRDTATKKKLYAAIADRLADSPGLRREDVLIFLNSNERDEWSFGNGVASYVKD